MAAPSAMDKRPWEFVVVTKQELKDAIATNLPNARMAAEAPLVVVVCGDKRRFIEDAEEYWVQDCSAVTENMLLAAHALGLGGVRCGIHPIVDREKTLDDILNLPEDLYPLNVVCFGIPASQQEPKNKWDATRIHYNKF